MKSLIAFSLALGAFAQAQPVIQSANGVVNASSELPDVAQGSWFVIFGTGLGPATIAIQSGLPYPATLAETSVTFTSSTGTTVSALMYYTLSTQVAGMLPSSTPTGSYHVTVTYNGQTSSPAAVNVVARNFGFATQTSNGQGPAQATYGGINLNRFTTGTIAQWATRPAVPGDAMVLWGTGLGADPASDITGGTSGDMTAAAQVKVMVGGIQVTPAYAGRSNGSPGLDQINFTVPANVTPSCFVSLQVSAGGRLSNLGSIAVAAAGQGACTNSSIAQPLLQTLDQGGTVIAGGFQLGKAATQFTASVSEHTDTVDGWFGKYTVDAVANSNLAVIQPGACFEIQRSGTIDQLSFGSPPATVLDAGAQLTLNGPNASNVKISRQSDNSYLSTLYSTGLLGVGAVGSPTLAAGTYTLTGSGGADIGVFSGSATLPGDFVWANQTAAGTVISRSSALNIKWTGGASGLVSMIAAVLTRVSGSGLSALYTATGITCTAEGSAGSFSVPSSYLSLLASASGDATQTTFGLLSVLAAPDPSTGQGIFTAPLTAGGSIGIGVLGYEVDFSSIVGFN